MCVSPLASAKIRRHFTRSSVTRASDIAAICGSSKLLVG
jgi:hypothetical protein